MLTLAIETSGLAGSLALFDHGDLLEERDLQLGVHHGQSLIPEIKRLFGDHRRVPRDCGLIAASIGPGSYTGLRVGVVCAKTLAYAAGCGIAGVETLEVVACNSPDDVSHVAVICDAQRGNVYVGNYERDESDEWRRLEPIRVVPAHNWADELRATDAVSGPAVEAFESLIKSRCRILPLEYCHPRAHWVARLGIRAAEIGRLSDPYRLEPLYLRRSSAEEKWEALGRK